MKGGRRRREKALECDSDELTASLALLPGSAQLFWNVKVTD